MQEIKIITWAYALLISVLLDMMQRDSTGLTAENKELKLKLKALEQQAHLRDGMGDLKLYGFLK